MHIPQQIDPQFRPAPDAPENSVITQIRPISSINNSNIIQFVTPKMPDVCIDTSATRLSVEFQILQEDGKAVVTPAGKYISTINSQLDSLFSGISIGINGEQILSSNHNHVLSFFMKQLNFSSEYRKSVLASSNYFETSAGDEGVATGTSFLELKKTVLESKKVQVAGSFPHPFFQSSKFLPPDTELSVTLSQTPNEIFLIHDSGLKLKVVIVDIYMSLRLVKLENNLQSALSSALNKSPYIYPFKHTVLKTFTLAKGASSYTIHNSFYGVLPSRIFALQIPTEAFNGTISTSPLSFKHNKLNNFKFVYNGTSIPLEKINFSMPGNAHYLFEHINSVLKINVHPVTPSYTMAKYISDAFFLGESLISDCSSSQNTHPFVQGALSVELAFSEALTENTTLVLIGEHSRSFVSIDKGVAKLIEV
jgi:hypothetical protein